MQMNSLTFFARQTILLPPYYETLAAPLENTRQTTTPNASTLAILNLILTNFKRAKNAGRKAISSTGPPASTILNLSRSSKAQQDKVVLIETRRLIEAPTIYSIFNAQQQQQ